MRNSRSPARVSAAYGAVAYTRRTIASGTRLFSAATAHPPPVFFRAATGAVISPFHDIPLKPSAEAVRNICKHTITLVAGVGASTVAHGHRMHDLPAQSLPQAVFNFVCEIPRGQTAKLEIDTDSPHNPIVQDVTKKGACWCLASHLIVPRARPIPHHLGPRTTTPTRRAGEPRFYGIKSLVNYGAIPQTYEDPSHADEWTHLKGERTARPLAPRAPCGGSVLHAGCE